MNADEEVLIGRAKELSLLDSLYHSDKFEMLLVHGRRRVVVGGVSA